MRKKLSWNARLCGPSWQWNVHYFLLPTDSSQVGVNGPPDPHAAFPQTLTDGKLQVQQRNALQNQQDEERDHERPWKKRVQVHAESAEGFLSES